MVDINLLTIFIAITTVAVLIQTGILVGLFVMSTKVSRRADQAMDATRNLLGPLQTAAGNLQALTSRIAEFSTAAQDQLRQFEQRWRRSA